MSEQAKWDDPELTPEVAWAMGVEAAGEHADASGGQVDRRADTVDWHQWKANRKHSGITERWGRPFPLYQRFRNGWQSQRSLLLGEFVVKALQEALLRCAGDGDTTDDVLDMFTEWVKFDQWFAGAGE